MYGVQTIFSGRLTPMTTAGVVALTAGGLVGGALLTRAALNRWGTPVLPPLSGEAGNLVVDGQDAQWVIEPSVGGEPVAWIWSIYALPAGSHIESSGGEFASAQAARDDLQAYGASKGWVFA